MKSMFKLLLVALITLSLSGLGFAQTGPDKSSTPSADQKSKDKGKSSKDQKSKTDQKSKSDQKSKTDQKSGDTTSPK